MRVLLLAPGRSEVARKRGRPSARDHGRPRQGPRDRASDRHAARRVRGPNLCKPAQPHEGASGAREGDPSGRFAERASATRVAGRTDPDRREIDQEPWRATPGHENLS